MEIEERSLQAAATFTQSSLLNLDSFFSAMNIHSEVCLLDYGGGCEIPQSKLKECWKVAEKLMKELCQLLEDTLKDADGKAQKERLERLQQQQHGNLVGNTSLPSPNETPYFQQTYKTAEMNVELNVSSDQIVQAQTKAEEVYRRQALDYSQGHIASKVREDNPTGNRSSAQQNAASLLEAMLKSAYQEESKTNKDDGDNSLPIEQHKTNKVDFSSTDAIKAGLNNEKSISCDGDLIKKMDLDDDEEEEEAPVVFQSEFQSVIPDLSQQKKEDTKRRNEKKPILTDTPDDDLVDLSMAIKKKKKKSKSKSKKK
jgi:hypothetical protein